MLEVVQETYIAAVAVVPEDVRGGDDPTLYWGKEVPTTRVNSWEAKVEIGKVGTSLGGTC